MAGLEVAIEVDDAQHRAVMAMLKRIAPIVNPGIQRRAITRIVIAVQGAATSGKYIRLGAAKSPPIARKLTSRLGGAGLIGSIATDLSGLPRVGRTGTELLYGEVHEEGGVFRIRAHSRKSRGGGQHRVRAHSATFPKRPWMKPAVDEISPKMEAIWVKVIEEQVY